MAAPTKLAGAQVSVWGSAALWVVWAGSGLFHLGIRPRSTLKESRDFTRSDS